MTVSCTPIDKHYTGKRSCRLAINAARALVQSAKEEIAAVMATVLSISSQVVFGHVGNSAGLFVMQRMGHEVLSVPTIVLSNRPGYSAIAGERIAPNKLNAMLEAARTNGWLCGLDAVVTGYLPTEDHVALCASWIKTIKTLNPNTVYLCDPIIGDEPAGVYIDEAAARAVRALLVPHADIVTPNAFELSWLSGRAVREAADAVTAALALGRPTVIATSAPVGEGLLANILVRQDETAATASVKRKVEAHGTGDFFASLFLSQKLRGLNDGDALRAAAFAIDLVLDKSDGRSELALIETQDLWAMNSPGLAPLVPLGPRNGPR